VKAYMYLTCTVKPVTISTDNGVAAVVTVRTDISSLESDNSFSWQSRIQMRRVRKVISAINAILNTTLR